MATMRSSSNGARFPTVQGSDSVGVSGSDVVSLLRVLKSGLPFAKLTHFSKTSGLSVADLSEVLEIPPRTMARRKLQGTLTTHESERLLRLGRIFDQAVDLFEGDRDAARAWLCRPAKALGNHIPLQWARSELGARAVEDLIGRLEFGVYS